MTPLEGVLAALAYMIGLTPQLSGNAFVQCLVAQYSPVWKHQAQCGWKLRGTLTEPYVRYDQTISYSIDQVPDAYRGAVRDAFAWWNRQVFGLKFREVSACEDRCIDMRFEPLSAWTLGRAWLPCSGEPQAGDVMINSGYDWINNPGQLPQVLRHEIGHAIGLGHSNNWFSLMGPVLHDEGRYLVLTDRRALGEMYNIRIWPGLPVYVP